MLKSAFLRRPARTSARYGHRQATAALTLFLSHHLIHGVDDGSGSLKYAVCEDCCMCTVEDQHMHFYCEQCHKTYCIRSVHAPTVNLPEGFMQTGINYVIKGICADCAVHQKIDTEE